MADESVIQTAKDQIERIFQVLSLGASDRAKVIEGLSGGVPTEPNYDALIDLPDDAAIVNALESVTGIFLADYFRHFFPGGHPEMLEDFEQRSLIRSAVAARKMKKANENK